MPRGWGHACLGGMHAMHAPPCRQTDTCENLRKLRLRAVNIGDSTYSQLMGWMLTFAHFFSGIARTIYIIFYWSDNSVGNIKKT